MATHVLKNQFVRYLVCLIAGTNLMLFLYAHDFVCAGIFILTAIVASFYSKYMVVILVVAMVICNIICVSSIRRVEGFKAKKMFKSNKSKVMKKDSQSKTNSSKDESVDEPVDGSGNNNNANSGSGSTSGGGDNPTMAQNMATILSMLETVKKELKTVKKELTE